LPTKVHTDISSNAQKYIHTLLQVPQKYIQTLAKVPTKYMPTRGPFGCFKQATESVQNPEKLTKTSEREREKYPLVF
jgi:hypothetical protein